MSTQDHGGRTALDLAAERGSQKMIKLLISQGAEASPVDRLGRTPLHLSAQLGYGEATKLLVDGGALVSAVDSAGRTARDLAEEKGKARAIKALSRWWTVDRLRIRRSSDITLSCDFTQLNQLSSSFHNPVFLPASRRL